MTHGGFNPFRDGHGRFADRPGGGGGSRETLSAPLPAKVEWEKDGVRVEFTGGKLPTYRVMHRDQMIKEFPATTKWRQDLAAATQHAQAYLVTVGTTRANQAVRALADDQRGGGSFARDMQTLTEEARRTPSDHHAMIAAGKRVLAEIDQDPDVVSARSHVANVERAYAAAKQRVDPLGVEAGAEELSRARWRAVHAIGRVAGDLLERRRGTTRAADVDVDPRSARKGRELFDEVVEFLPRPMVGAANNAAGKDKLYRVSQHALLIEEQAGVRASYDHLRRRILLDATDGRRVAAHELGHWLENNVPGMQDAAQAYLLARTAGQPLQKLNEVTNAGYGDHEVTRPDQFVHAYMGKHYGSGDTELISMLFEDYTANNHEIAVKDPEAYTWFLGVLHTL